MHANITGIPLSAAIPRVPAPASAIPAPAQETTDKKFDPYAPLPVLAFPQRVNRYNPIIMPNNKPGPYLPGPGVIREYLKPGYDLPVPDPSWGVLALWSELPNVTKKEPFLSIWFVDVLGLGSLVDTVLRQNYAGCVVRYQDQQARGFFLLASKTGPNIETFIRGMRWTPVYFSDAYKDAIRLFAGDPPKFEEPHIQVYDFGSDGQNIIPSVRKLAWDYGFSNELVPTGKTGENWLAISNHSSFVPLIEDQPKKAERITVDRRIQPPRGMLFS
jgi:hypothetical protein